MVIIEDTRNKIGKHNNVRKYCDKHGIMIVREKLDVGDYQLPGGKTAIDTKKNLSELATNLMNRADKARFWREVRRSRETGIKLIILCEHGGKIKTIKDVATWQSKYSPVSGRALMEAIYRCSISYGVEFIFCDKRCTGKKIVELLGDANNELCRTDQTENSNYRTI